MNHNLTPELDEISIRESPNHGIDVNCGNISEARFLVRCALKSTKEILGHKKSRESLYIQGPWPSDIIRHNQLWSSILSSHWALVPISLADTKFVGCSSPLYKMASYLHIIYAYLPYTLNHLCYLQ